MPQGTDNSTPPPGAALLSPRSVALLWFGIAIGLYAIEFPARFGAPAVTFPAAIDIGRLVFIRLNSAEFLLLGALAVTAWLRRERPAVWVAVALITAALAWQSAWLLPELVARAEALVSGAALPPSAAHRGYAAAELLKGLSLLAVVLLARR